MGRLLQYAHSGPTDADLYTAPVEVLSVIPSASYATLCRAILKLGDSVDSVNDLLGTGTLSVNVNLVNPDSQAFSVEPQTRTYAIATTKMVVMVDSIVVPANHRLVVTIQSNNIADTSVEYECWCHDQQPLMIDSAGIVEANVTQIGGGAVSGHNAVLKLKELSISNADGDAVTLVGFGSGYAVRALGGYTAVAAVSIEAQAGDTHGLQCLGQGSGCGVRVVGGANADGVRALGGAAEGSGIVCAAQAGNGHGLECEGYGAGHGAWVVGGATGSGLLALGGATSGSGAVCEAQAGNGNGLECNGDGDGQDIGAELTGANFEPGMVDDVYEAAIEVYEDAGVDRYRVLWLKNRVLVDKVDITSPVLSVYTTSDGATLINTQPMDWDAGDRALQYDATDEERNAGGDVLKVEVSATIDGESRSCAAFHEPPQ